MKHRFYSVETLIKEELPYEVFVKLLVMSSLIDYREANGKDPSAIYLTHDEMMAIVNLHWPGKIKTIDELYLEDIPIIERENAKYLFEP